MRPPARTFQMFSLLIGAIALVLSSAGLVGASPAEGDEARGNSESAVPEHAAEKQGGPDHVDDEIDDDSTNTSNDSTNDGIDDSTNDGIEDGESAHPSGNDRLVEPGSSGTQGESPSDPDGMTNGGADKPGGEGGIFTGDQDGNNGCGNDQDFEDDNNGLCLGPDGAPGQQADDDDTSTGGEDDTDVEDGDESNDAGADKVTICHATGSETNPYNLITVSVNSILNPAGHGDHEDDIIPPFEGFDGQGDLDLLDAGCEVDDDTSTGGEGEDVDGDEGEDVDGVDGDEDNLDVDGDDADGDEDVLGEVIVNVPTPDVRPATPATPTVTPATPASPAFEVVADRNSTQVLGSQVTRSSQLPRTGDETTNLVPFGLGLVLLGFGLQHTSKRFSAARVS